MLGMAADKCNMITLHIGSGSSLCAIRGGQSIDTTMGMTPLEGVVMGTRCGSVDPAIATYLQRGAGLTPDQVDEVMTKKSGLLGLYEKSFDARDIRDAASHGDAKAALAQNVMFYSIKKALGAYLAVLNPLHALVFTAGQGERAPEMRAAVLDGLDHLGIAYDPALNAISAGGNPQDVEITAKNSKVRILVVQTNEELEIAGQTLALIQ
ncbi:hypothetical protein FACS1894186_8560 [Alphaproteobacteria bacterium]|nr:hypothetical protein FACS1894186_8560 [Alphaproteobacteria bacterium]